MNRRQLLVISTITFIGSGCTEQSSPTGHRDPATDTSATDPTITSGRNGANDALGIFEVINYIDSTQTFSITVTNVQSGAVLLDDSYTLSDNGTKYFDNVINTMGAYEISITSETGASGEFTWRIENCDNYEYILVLLRKERIEFLERQHTIVPPPTCARKTSTNN